MKKSLPFNSEAEVSILGGLMMDMEAWDEVADKVTAGDFFVPAHKLIFEAIFDLNKKGQRADIVVVSNHLTQAGLIDRIGGMHYLVQLIEDTPSTVNIASYANIVKEKSLTRQMIKAGQKISEVGISEDFENLDHYLETSEASIFKVAQKGDQSDNLMAAPELVKNTIDHLEYIQTLEGNITGIATGFYELDEMLSGLHSGEMSIIAARPSMGKTAFSLNILSHMALKEKKSVLYFSVEMPKEQMMMRVLASNASVSLSEIRSGGLNTNEWNYLLTSADEITKANIYIDDTSGISPFEIRSKARKIKSKKGLDIIIIDYLQLMSLKQRVESREREVSEISKSLKALAKELKIPVIALAQLNRSVEGRSDRRPMLSDLRESGSIEQDADVIMMLYREDYYERDNPTGQAEVIVAKQRNGPTGKVNLLWTPMYGRFENNSQGQINPNAPPPTDADMRPQKKSGNDPRFKEPNKNFAPG